MTESFNGIVPSKTIFPFSWNRYLKRDDTSLCINYPFHLGFQVEGNRIIDGTVLSKNSLKMMITKVLKISNALSLLLTILLHHFLGTKTTQMNKLLKTNANESLQEQQLNVMNPRHKKSRKIKFKIQIRFHKGFGLMAIS